MNPEAPVTRTSPLSATAAAIVVLHRDRSTFTTMELAPLELELVERPFCPAVEDGSCVVLIWGVDVIPDSIVAELRAVCEACGVDSRGIRPTDDVPPGYHGDQSPFLLAHFPSVDAARTVCNRCVSVKMALQLWLLTGTLESLVEVARARELPVPDATLPVRGSVFGLGQASEQLLSTVDSIIAHLVSLGRAWLRVAWFVRLMV